MTKIFSFDAETDGLWGRAFAIGAAVYEDGNLTAQFTAYTGPDGVESEWVRKNILPELDGLDKTHETYAAMLAAFAKFYLEHKGDAHIVVHMGVPVEAKMFTDMYERGLIGDWDGPYPLIDIAGVLLAKGKDPTSVDAYNLKHKLLQGRDEANGLAPHHPLYDSIAAAVAYMDLVR